MKRVLSLCALLAASSLALAPEHALAKAVEDVTYAADPSDVIITVFADETLNTPSVRTYSGLVRVRFYDAEDPELVRFEGDGGAIKVIELSRGSDKSAALNIALGDKTKLASSDVRVERDGEKTVIRIARGLLPALGKGVPMVAAVAPAPAKPQAPAKPAAVQPSLPAAPVAQSAPAPAPKPAAEAPAEAPAAPKPVFQKPEKSASDAKDAQGELKLAKDEGSPMPLMIAISALLALAYFGLKLFMKKQQATGAVSAIPTINVVAQKRLGPRHQLVIVRAFDRDYLLSIQGGQTTVVARSSRKRLDEAEELLSPRSRPRTSSSAPSGAFSGAPLAGAGRDFEDDEPTFGGELFKQALEQRERAREQTAGFRLETARAQARAELGRIADEQRSELERDAEAPLREPAAVEPSPQAISESVSGLLRLRRNSGR